LTSQERLQVEYLPIEKLKKWPDNPRVMSPDQAEALHKSLEHFDIVEPLVVDQHNRIVGGHQRYDQLVALGYKTVPVIRKRLSEREFKSLNLALNRISGQWDTERLAPILVELRNLPEIDLTGFQPQEIESLIREVMPEANGEEDAILEPPRRAITRAGDLWECGSHKILCADATEPESWKRLLGGEKLALVVTDPPYGEQYELSNKFTHDPVTGVDTPNKSWGEITGDSSPDIALAAVPHIFENLTENGSAYIFCGKKLLVALCNWLDKNNIHYPPFLIWDKGFPVITWHRYHLEHEMIVWCGPGSRPGGNAYWFGDKYETSIWRIPLDATGPSRLHPTQKPVALMERPIGNSSKAGDTIGDPFLGSGSTLIAAEKLGRTFAGIEIEPTYCDISIQRWENLTSSQAILESSGQPFSEVAKEREGEG
jgi:DNA modification methylase